MAFSFERAVANSGKALLPIPAFMDNTTPVSTYQPGVPNARPSTISQREAKRHSSAYGGEQAIDWIYECVNLYSDAASSADFRLEGDDGTKLVRMKTVGTPPEYDEGPQRLYELLDQPNPFMLYEELIERLVQDVLLVGNAYWFKWRMNDAGQPLAIYPLAPAYVKIVTEVAGPAGYVYQPPGAAEPLAISPDEIVHFRRPNPHSPYYGMGVIQGGGRAMDLELAITDTMAHYYENRAAPSLVIQSERRVPREVFQKLRAQLRARTAGSQRSGELLVLEAGLTADKLGADAQTAEFENLSRLSQQRIYSKFRAHPLLLGQPATSQGNDKVTDIRREFDNSVLRPFLNKLSRQISVALTESYGAKFYIDHRSTLPTDELVKVVSTVATLPGVKIREVRKLLAPLGIEESTGDPKIDEFVLNKPGPEMDANGRVIDPVTGKEIAGQSIGAADRPLAGEPGRPPLGENTSGFGSAG